MNQQSTPATAQQRYQEHRDAILDLLDKIRSDLAMHNRNFDLTARRHWGAVGDLAHVAEQLTEVHKFLNNED